MTRLMISGFAAVALLAAVTLRSHSISTERSATTTGMASLKKTPAAVGLDGLPIEDFEDLSLVFSAPAKP
ncbi:hypothetical protein [Bradyrhizobium sp.]|uniref:hypothetical protein n=1 Tax=Bradyrhizobium sp. TaxID=376 RepID=UPI0025BD3F45|nr:hypothetical protein [Bradyrhizobium sp.]